jgi:hypothetical protein
MTKDLLKELFEYKDGNLIRKVSRSNRVKVGDVAGCLNDNGYIVISVNGTRYFAHRMIWIYHNGEIDKDLCVDHINGNKDDNSIGNLRLVTNQENSFNRPNAKGYYWNKPTNKFKAEIKLNGKKTSLGSYDNEREARKAYLNAKEKYHRIELH